METGFIKGLGDQWWAESFSVWWILAWVFGGFVMLCLPGLARIFTSPKIHQTYTTKYTTVLAKPFLPGIRDHFCHPKIHQTSNQTCSIVFYPC